MIRYTMNDPDLYPVHAVKPHPDNPNSGDIDEIVSSILINGVYRPVYASKRTTHILLGHHLYAALIELGAQQIPVEWIDAPTDEAELRILMADNRIARLAKLDPGLEREGLLRLKETEFGLRGSGYDDRYLEKLNSAIDTPLNLGEQAASEDLQHDIECPACGHWFTRGKAHD